MAVHRGSLAPRGNCPPLISISFATTRGEIMKKDYLLQD